MVVGLPQRQVQEGQVVDEFAASQPEFPEGLALGNEGCNGLVSDLCALVQVDFEDVRAIVGKGKDCIVSQLVAVVEFELADRVMSAKGPRPKMKQSGGTCKDTTAETSDSGGTSDSNATGVAVKEQKETRKSTYPLDVAAVLGQLNHTVVGNEAATGDVQALQSLAVLGDGHDGHVSDVLVARDVEGEKGRAVFH